MTFRTFEEIEHYILEQKIVKRIALCGSHDEPALEAVAKARAAGLVEAVLIGDEPQTKAILRQMGETAENYEFIHQPNEAEAAKTAIGLVKEGKADFPMKGLMQTSSYMRAILDKEAGLLPKGNLISMCTAFEYPDQNRLMIVTDCAVNITPDVSDKVQIIKNAVRFARALGLQTPKVAALSALEKVNPKIVSTVEANELAGMEWEDCIVEGPFALDNAVSSEAAQHKGIESRVGGQADILLCSDLCMGNVIHKSIHYFAHLKMAGAICGTTCPVIMSSRTDSPNTKYNSILTAVLQAL